MRPRVPDDIPALVTGLLNQNLPKPEWTHEAHLAATLYMMREREDIDLARDLPGIIRAYNQATGVPNSDDDGYHETITQLYLTAIAAFDAHLPANMATRVRCARLINSTMGAHDFPLNFYSKARLFSVEARRGWVAPDLKALEFGEFLG